MTPAGRMLRPHVVRRWRALAAAGGATVALTAAELAKPWPLALLVDRLLAHRTAPFTLDAGDVRLLVVVAAVVLLIALLEAAAQYAADLSLQTAGERISHDLRVRVYEHLQRLSLGFHQGKQKGDLVNRVTSDVDAMGELFSQSLGEMVQAALLAVGMTVVLVVIDPVLALVALATAPLMATLSYVYRRRVRVQSRVRRAEEGNIASIASEALSAMSVVKAFGSEGYESRRVREGSERRLASGVAVARLQARFDGLVGAVKAISTAAVLVVGALRVSHGAISPGELLVFASYTRKAQSPMRSFAQRADEDLGDDGEGRPGRRAAGRRRHAARAAERVSRRARHRRRRARGRVVRLRRRAAGAERRLAARRAGRAAGADGAVGRGQVDARRARRPLLRPDRGTRADRRARRARVLADVAARAGRGRAPGHRAVQRHGARQHRLRDRRVARGRRRRRALGGGARVHLRPAGGLRHRPRAAGPRAVGRPAPAHRRRAHAAARPADPRARRADHGPRRRQRDRRARRAAGAHAGPHDDPDHALAAARAHGRPRRRAQRAAASARRRRRMSSPRVLVTGCAGFIGSHLTEALLAAGHEVVGARLLQRQLPGRAEARQPRAGARPRPLRAARGRPRDRRSRRASSRAATSSSTSRPSRACGRAGAAASTASCTTTSRRRSGCSRRCGPRRARASSTPRRPRSTASPSGSRRPRTPRRARSPPTA